jgi:P-type Ca2+ transporter type 2C
MTTWHHLPISEVLELLQSAESGLSPKEAAARLERYGRNALLAPKPDSLYRIFFRQFASPLIYLLLIAAAVVFFLGERADAAIIMLVLVFNAVVGMIQEGKAERTLLSLRKLTNVTTTVIRDGKEMIISEAEVAPGDIVLLVEGQQVPADARVIHAINLKVTESALTGETEAVAKTSDLMPAADAVMSDQTSMVFKGTLVVAGTGRAVVVATGLNTVIGKISFQISGIDTEIPLKREMKKFAHLIMAAVLLLAAFLFFAGVGMGRHPEEMFLTVIAISVSMVPEGLPVVITLILAVGVERMSRKHALVKRLQAVEALGHADIIAVDKTGTITKNEMVVRRVYVDGKTFDITGEGYLPTGEVLVDSTVIDPLNHPELIFAGRIATYCANARVALTEVNDTWLVSGDPTEAALLVLGEKIGFSKSDLETESPQVGEIPFNYHNKYHVTLHQGDTHQTLTVVGAPEMVLEASDKIWRGGRHLELTHDERQELEQMLHKLSNDGYRVLAFSVKEESSFDDLDTRHIKHLTFGGFYAIKDTLRPEVHEAMARAKAAGIRVVMITGDHKTTAEAVGREAGIFQDGDEVLTGVELETLNERELAIRLDKVTIFARVTPDHKMRIIEAYKHRGETVAMTGDGVNDAPSLVAADLGVAMGKVGTEVAKEASDIILLDDNFGSMVSAIEEGRNIYRTVKKAVLYLFSTSLGEIFAISVAMFAGYPLPILAVQIIWLNFITDGFLTVAWAMEPHEPGLLKGKMGRGARKLIDGQAVRRSLLMGVVMMIGTLVLFDYYYQIDMVKAWTVSLTVLAVFQWFNAWNCRDAYRSVFNQMTSNLYLIAATVVVIGLQLLAVYHPLFQKYLKTTSLSFNEWLLIIGVSLSIVLVEEVRKLIARFQLAHR